MNKVKGTFISQGSSKF